ncbi:hypothetical protein B0H14DRAFT_2586750 [Mycena olivaceomarginata]|nr:hypothetical protein B0H14DRAFT_2586750 [Mycena olivaceomarginata]
MEPTVQAHQSRFKLVSPELSAEIIPTRLTLSADHGGYRPAFGTESGPSSDNLSHTQYGEPLNYQPQLAAIEQQFDFFTNPSMHPKQSARDPWVDFLEYVVFYRSLGGMELYHQLFAFFDFLSYVLFMRRFFSYFLDVLGDVLADLEAIPEDNGILVDEWEDDDYLEIESIKPGTGGKELLIFTREMEGKRDIYSIWNMFTRRPVLLLDLYTRVRLMEEPVRVDLSERGGEGGSPEVGGGGCGGGALITLHKGGEEYLANAILNLTKRE